MLGAEYVLLTPKSRSFYFHASPLPGLVRSDAVEGDTRVYSFKAAEIAPLLPEPTMPPLGEVLGHVHVSTYKTWDQVASWYAGLAKDQLKPDDEVRRRVAALTKGLTDPADKVRAIYDYVVQRTRYVALEFGIYGYKPRPCALTFARGFGDCKDKATLIVTMLKEAGIPASIVLVRTGMRGEFETEPASLAPFDHAIAYVPSMNLFLDGTAEYTGSTELPPLDRGALVLVVDETGKGKLTHLPDPDADATRRMRKIDAVLGTDGTAQLDVRTDTSGALAAEERQRYHAKGTRRERVARDLSGRVHRVRARARRGGSRDERPRGHRATGEDAREGERGERRSPRRNRRVDPGWTDDAPGGEVRLAVEPQAGPPPPRAVDARRRVRDSPAGVDEGQESAGSGAGRHAVRRLLGQRGDQRRQGGRSNQDRDSQDAHQARRVPELASVLRGRRSRVRAAPAWSEVASDDRVANRPVRRVRAAVRRCRLRPGEVARLPRQDRGGS